MIQIQTRLILYIRVGRTRFYGLFDDNTIGYKAEPSAMHEYDIEEVTEFLESVVGNELL